MDLFGLNRSSSDGSESSRGSGGSGGSGSQQQQVLSIECVTGSSRAEEWSGDMLQTGDIVEELRMGEGGGGAVRAPFRNGRSGVQKMLRAAYKKGETSVVVRVRRGKGETVELHACVVPHEGGSGGGSGGGGGGKRQYVLRSVRDPNYAVCFVDRNERECVELQGSKSSRVASALSKAQLQDGYVSYSWDKKMRESLPIANSSCFLSLLVLPKATDAVGALYNSLEDTLARANAWLNASQASGVPVVFMNVQTEAMLTKISGDTASSTVNSGSISDLSTLANSSLHGFEDYHGVDIGVVKAVRLWYTPVAGEYAVEIRLLDTDTKLGFAVSRSEEGFIYISSIVDDDDASLPSTRSGIRDLYKQASRASKLLVISRLSNEKVLPWMVSPIGAIRCFDTVSLSQKLSLHRHALRPILIHVLMWDREQPRPPRSSKGSAGSYTGNAPMPTVILPPSTDQVLRNISLNDEEKLVRDASIGEASFRFIDFNLNKSWV